MDPKGYGYIDEVNRHNNEMLKKYLKTTDEVMREEAEQKKKSNALSERETEQEFEERRAEKEK